MVFIAMEMNAQSKPPTPGLLKPSNPPQSQAENHHQAAYNHQDVTSNGRIEINSNISAPKADTNTTNTQKELKEVTPPNWWIVIFTGILAIFAGFQVLAMSLQYIAMRKQIKLFKETTSEQLKIMQTQLRETTDQFHSSHRPWCAISEGIETVKHLRIESGKIKSTIRYSIKNCGTSPAFRQTAIFAIIIAPMTQILAHTQRTDDRGPFEMLTKIGGHTILPGETIKVPNSVIECEITYPVPPNTKITALLKVSIIYRDEVGALHATEDSWIYLGNGNIQEYLPTSAISGHWIYCGVGSNAY
jgi:hypothetical protein